MPLLSLGQFLGDEDACCILDHFLVEAARHLPVNRLIAPDITSFEQGPADSEILPGHAHGFVDGAARMPYLQPQIPKRQYKEFNDLPRHPTRFLRRRESKI